MKTNFKKINFKDKRFIIPLISLPLVLWLTYNLSGYIIKKDKTTTQTELATSLGETSDSILSKDEAYDQLYSDVDQRTMLDGLNKEQDSTFKYNDTYADYQKRMIDSMAIANAERQKKGLQNRQQYYQEQKRGNSDEQDFQKSMEMIRALNGQGGESASSGGTASGRGQNQSYSQSAREEQNDPVKMLKAQMLVMDSIEKSKDPEYQSQLKAEQKLLANKAKMKAFMNRSMTVRKAALNPSFNSIAVSSEPNFIKAVIDENKKAFLGTRIRLRLLDDVYIGNRILKKGNVVYGLVSGFSLQRVEFNIVSILSNGEIFPVNLTIYDLDGMKGLHIPESMFREMVRELGNTNLQGSSMEQGNSGFFTSLANNVFSSASQTITNIIKKNKVKLKYNSFIYLINEKDLQQDEQY